MTGAPPSQATPVLSVEDLRIDFAGRSVVQDLGFTVNAGETVAVVGESGSGKSVTALSILRLLPSTARMTGAIRLDGRDILSLSESQMREVRGGQVSMIFQEPMTSLNPVLPVGFQVKEALRYHSRGNDRECEAEALRLFDRVRIPDAKRRFNQHPHTFSGGMRQRVMIAMALACRPKLLIADEPTTALDVTVQAQILDLLRELQRETGTAILFITHDMGVVAQISDRVLVMRNGRLVEDGTAEAVFAAPEHPYTQMLLAAVPRLGDMAGSTGPRRFADDAGDRIETVKPQRKPILEVRDLVTRFPVKGGFLSRHVGNVHAVERVSFTVREGETLALVGESGCGKSTTGRSILRLVEPAAGSVRFDGQDILTLDKKALQAARRKIQMIFQDPFGSLDPRQTVGSAIAEPMLLHGVATKREVREKVAYLLHRVGLEPGHATRFPHEFSGGQRQRLCIARALALQPKLVIADEAVSALDVSIKAQVIDLLLDLQDEFNLAYLFISHDMAVVERVSHRVAVMYLGEIVEIGPRAEVIGNPRHDYTRRLLAAVPVPDPRRRSHDPIPPGDEPRSPIHPLDHVAPPRNFVEVAPDHFVLAS
ncbi:glutathione ABC transporter ATP-binding protein [Skermanella stibiiresistens SB22]|uniref:Glutathione import ATP-binding protein GsiA n=1 Tax=Skermanella stibiiresistens SB22 TaxID=1385369 RepID=W9H8I2_9PROT|nr:ABC transporter ATP-binding protein [Skermanella stibiiresistens]EWY40992.1 glutathione ABC transporter ATP-binding protein [Skermanella stibiiresistens SB22]